MFIHEYFYSNVKLHSIQHAFIQTHLNTFKHTVRCAYMYVITILNDQDGWYSASRDAARCGEQRANGGVCTWKLTPWLMMMMMMMMMMIDIIYMIYVVTSLKTNMTMENPLTFYRKFIVLNHGGFSRLPCDCFPGNYRFLGFNLKPLFLKLLGYCH